MKYIFNVLILTAVGLLILFPACQDDSYKIPEGSFDELIYGPPPVVKITDKDGVQTLKVDGLDFYVKGVASNNYHELAINYGANTARTYGVGSDTKRILDNCYKASVYVNIGLAIKREADGFDYNNESAVKEQFELLKTQVERFKDHPAILMWSIGNEADASYTNKKLWDAVNDIAEMIHKIDPNRPTTTALAGAKEEAIKDIIERAPAIDILSINSYAPNLPTALKSIRNAGWTKPYMITEFGPRGTWQMNPEPNRILPWGALVEQTSSEKETDYLSAYQNHIEANKDNGCIGSFVFLWGYQTHGEVLNWYGLFDKKGYSYPSVDAMQFVWTGSYPENKAPVIASRKDMTMNGKVAEDIIEVVKSSANNTASVVATDPEGDFLSYDWMIMKEGTKSSDGSLPDGIANLIEDNTKKDITFTAPKDVGGYRLYVFVRDDVNKKVASACIPFLVK